MNPLLLPIAAGQALWVRRRVVAPPPASGPTHGVTGPSGQALRLLVVGESTAAGCGAETHDKAFVGACARSLSAGSGRQVEWTVRGRYGATVRRVRHRMLTDLPAQVDVAVLLIGVNDVLTRTSVQDWHDDLAAVLDVLSGCASTTLVAGLPPFDALPALPRVLGGWLAARGRVLDDIARRSCEGRATCTWVDSRELVSRDRALYSADGFHPSPAGYERWADAISGHVAYDDGVVRSRGDHR